MKFWTRNIYFELHSFCVKIQISEFFVQSNFRTRFFKIVILQRQFLILFTFKKMSKIVFFLLLLKFCCMCLSKGQKLITANHFDVWLSHAANPSNMIFVKRKKSVKLFKLKAQAKVRSLKNQEFWKSKILEI